MAAKARRADLEAWEGALRAAVLSAGARALSGLLSGIGSGRQHDAVLCGCGARMGSQGVRKKMLHTILGPVPYSRSMFMCPACRSTRYPGDEALDVAGTGRSPGLRRMMSRAGSKSTFKEGRDDLKIYAGLSVSAKDVERVAEGIGRDMEDFSSRERTGFLSQGEPDGSAKTIPVLYVSYDGTGVPMTRAELMGRKGKQPDGSARTREAKIGCVFTQTATDQNGFPVRDPDSTTFVGAIQPGEAFGWRIYAEALRRGLAKAHRVVVLGDGAEWIRTIAQTHFPQATQIIDLYHAREHVAQMCKVLFGATGEKTTSYRIRWWTDLDNGQVEKIAQQARENLPSDPDAAAKAAGEIAYLEKNAERMRYAQFRAQGFFVGSGVVEAGCKTVIGTRLKQSGMEWSVRGANAIIALRCMIKSERFEDYWESRVA